MDIIIFTHPVFLSSQSMPRYAKMLEKGLLELGHTVEFWSAKPTFYRLPFPVFLKKWLGYIDQFIIFPLEVKRRLKSVDRNTLFVFADQALGPWVPLVADRLHVIHCHDFLAQQSALGAITENKIRFTGNMYQKYIRKGYLKGENFISISKKTQSELHSFLLEKPKISEVVYNGLNQDFTFGNVRALQKKFSERLGINLIDGFVLHVGGNQFYKNRTGVIQIYNSWRKISKVSLPLLLVGATPNLKLIEIKEKSLYSEDIHFLTKINDTNLKELYQCASVLLFPSLAEGFGWPIAEAMASGCPVITTNEAPMNEVGGLAAFYIDKKPFEENQIEKWVNDSAIVLEKVLCLKDMELQISKEKGLENAKRFNTELAIQKIEFIYKRIITNS